MELFWLDKDEMLQIGSHITVKNVGLTREKEVLLGTTAPLEMPIDRIERKRREQRGKWRETMHPLQTDGIQFKNLYPAIYRKQKRKKQYNRKKEERRRYNQDESEDETDL